MKGKILQKKIAYILAAALIFTSVYVGGFSYADEPEDITNKGLDYLQELPAGNMVKAFKIENSGEAITIFDKSGTKELLGSDAYERAFAKANTPIDLTNASKKMKYIPDDQASAAIEDGDAYILYDPASHELTLKNIYYKDAQITLPAAKVTVNLVGKNMLFNQDFDKIVFKQGGDIQGKLTAYYNSGVESELGNMDRGVTFKGEGSLNTFSQNPMQIDGDITVESGKIYSNIKEVNNFQAQKFGGAATDIPNPYLFKLNLVCATYNQNGGYVLVTGATEIYDFNLINGKFLNTSIATPMLIHRDLSVTGGEFLPSFSDDAHVKVARGEVKSYTINDGVIVEKRKSDGSKMFTTYGNAQMVKYDENGEKTLKLPNIAYPGAEPDPNILIGGVHTLSKLEGAADSSLTVGSDQILRCELYINSIHELKRLNVEDVVSKNVKIVNEGIVNIALKISNREELHKKIKEVATYLNMSGSGVIKTSASDTYEIFYYNNDGTLKTTIDASTLPELTTANAGTVDREGLSWKKDEGADSYTLTLDNVLVKNTGNASSIVLPLGEKVTIELKGNSTVDGGIDVGGSGKLDLTIKGQGILNTPRLLGAGTNNDTVTIEGGAKVYVKNPISYGGSGNEDGFLNVKGQGTLLDVDVLNTPSTSYGISLQGINVADGAEMNIHAKKASVFAVAPDGKSAFVNVTNNSKLKVLCQYGVYVINGKLTVDSTSKLETDASSAGIVVVDKSAAKTQNDVLSLPGIPAGSTVTSTEKLGHKLWTVAKTGAKVAVVGNSTEPADDITGALGKLTIAADSLGKPSDGGRRKDEIKDGNKSDANPDDKEFDDVHKDDWYYDKVKSVVKHGYMTGISTNRFGPMMSTSRAMISQIIYNLEKKPATTAKHDFTDVAQGAWYEPSLNFTFDKDVMVGFPDKTFRGDDTITREQLTKVLYQYAIYKGYDSNTDADMSNYIDFDKAGDWSKPSIKWAVKHNIVKGRTATSLDPTSVLTRAELATVLTNFHTEFVK